MRIESPLLAALLAAGAALPAWGMGSLPGGAAALGEAAAVVARPAELDAFPVNPAAIVGVTESEILFGGAAQRQHGSYEAPGSAPAIAARARTYPLPAISAVFPLTPEWTVGVGLARPYLRHVSWPEGLADSLAVTAAEVSSAVLTAGFGWMASPRLSVGFGIDFVQGNVLVQSGYWPLPENPAQRGRARFQADGVGTGLSLGLLYRYGERTVAGAVVKVAGQLGGEGRGEFEVPAPYQSLYPEGAVRATLEAPLSLRAGVSVAPVPTWLVEVDAEWVGSRRLREVGFEFVEQETTWTWDVGWRDAVNLRLGTRVQANRWLTLRGGYILDWSLEAGSRPSALLPGRAEHTATAGVGIGNGRTRADLALAATTRSGSHTTTTGFPAGTLRSGALTISCGLSYRFPMLVR